MGSWDVKLYSIDTALDIKDDYIDQLKRGKTNEQVTGDLIAQSQDLLADEEEAAEFWFALADTQWKYGRLVPHVREKALEYLERQEHLKRWKEAGEKQYNARIKVLEDLKTELLSPMPPEKNVSQYRLYKCQWKIGDVFAYKFESDYSKEKGFYGKYILFRKVDEDTWWPGHVVPVVHVYKWIGNDVPNISIIKKLPCLPQFYKPIAYKNIQSDKILYRMTLLNTSKRVIPTNNLYLLGNLQDVNFSKKYKNERMNSYECYWKDFEQYIIDDYINWEKINI